MKIVILDTISDLTVKGLYSLVIDIYDINYSESRRSIAEINFAVNVGHSIKICIKLNRNR